VALHSKKRSRVGGFRDMRKVRFFSCHKTGHYSNQCPKKNNNNKKKESELTTITFYEMNVFAEKFDDKFSLVVTLSRSGILVELEDSGAWFLYSGSSHYMMGMRSVILGVLETGSYFHV
jgi:hypothetical protein